MNYPGHGRRTDLTACAAAALLLLTGCAGDTTTPTDTAPAPTSISASAAPAEATPTTSPAPAPTTAATAAAPALGLPPVLNESEPVSMTIPAIDTESELLHLGLRDNGSLKVPPEHPGAPASWYTGSPTPGERGPAVLLGHVNATGGGPGIFADLQALKSGDTIEITRADGTTAVFAVDRGEQYMKNEFPTHKVYGNTDAAELRLITCDGYDPAAGEFDDNYVVYATLTN